MIQTKDFLNYTEEIKDYVCDKYDISKEDLEIIQVWYCKTIQNHKGLFIIKNIRYNFIYQYFVEMTYNGDKNEIYLDFYNKEFKHTISLEN